MMRRKNIERFFLVLWIGMLLGGPLPAQEVDKEVAEAPATVRVQRVWIEPEAPGPETLCRLFVELESSGEATASLFAFEVEVNGVPLPVYGQELFAFPVGPGKTESLRLFNFWTSETGRPAPADGVLRLTVRLIEASWIEVEVEGNEETWTPVGPVDGLPSVAELRARLRKGV